MFFFSSPASTTAPDLMQMIRQNENLYSKGFHMIWGYLRGNHLTSEVLHFWLWPWSSAALKVKLTQTDLLNRSERVTCCTMRGAVALCVASGFL